MLKSVQRRSALQGKGGLLNVQPISVAVVVHHLELVLVMGSRLRVIHATVRGKYVFSQFVEAS